MNEQEQFLKDLEQNEENDAFNQPLIPEEEPKEEEVEEAPEEDEEPKLKNRRERRLSEKLSAERESSIKLAAKLEAITEANKARDNGSADEYLKDIERIYGTDSPEATAATDILKRSFTKIEDRAVERALETLRKEREEEVQKLQSEEHALDEMIENIEDEFNVELTSSQQKGFFQMLEKLSPKDTDGNVIAYADTFAVWEEYQARTKKKPDTKAKSLSSRSMTQSQTSPESTLTDDSTERFLKENGII